MAVQIYQELVFPKLLTTEEYSNAYSTQNTGGDPSKAYAFFKLVDPIANFARKYTQTTASFSQSYKLMLHRINTHEKAEKLLKEALDKVENEKFLALGPYTQNFYLIETYPYDLFEDNGCKISFTVGPENSNADFVELDSQETREVSFYGFSAVIGRPWYTPEVFGKKPWTIMGCRKGEYSDGTYTNKGVLPSVPAQLLISINQKGQRFLKAIISDLIPLTPVSGLLQSPANNMLNRKNAYTTNGLSSLLVDEFGNPIAI